MEQEREYPEAAEVAETPADAQKADREAEKAEAEVRGLEGKLK